MKGKNLSHTTTTRGSGYGETVEHWWMGIHLYWTSCNSLATPGLIPFYLGANLLNFLEDFCQLNTSNSSFGVLHKLTSLIRLFNLIAQCPCLHTQFMIPLVISFKCCMFEILTLVSGTKGELLLVLGIKEHCWNERDSVFKDNVEYVTKSIQSLVA